MSQWDKRIKQAAKAISESECILVGAGAGLSAAAGLEYGGERFQRNFADYIARYGVTDMYSATFYPFRTQEERWAHWARHILVNRYDQPATALYQDILGLVRDRSHFVITTNVESQFEKAGFSKDLLFEVQGNYGLNQCARGCHDWLYPNEALVREMNARAVDCRIPSELVPKCPICGGPMDVNLRKDAHFIEDAHWHESSAAYHAFLKNCAGKRLVLLEFGVGYNTPGIIRFPFERMAALQPNVTLIRFNRDYPEGDQRLGTRLISFDEEIRNVVQEMFRHVASACSKNGLDVPCDA